MRYLGVRSIDMDALLVSIYRALDYLNSWKNVQFVSSISVLTLCAFLCSSIWLSTTKVHGFRTKKSSSNYSMQSGPASMMLWLTLIAVSQPITSRSCWILSRCVKGSGPKCHGRDLMTRVSLCRRHHMSSFLHLPATLLSSPLLRLCLLALLCAQCVSRRQPHLWYLPVTDISQL